MLTLPDAAGPHRPVSTTVARRPGSVRRTSTIDTARPDGLLGDLVVTARARDLRTGLDGAPAVVDEAQMAARIDGATRQLVSIQTRPQVPGLDRLVGCLVGAGFRATMAQVMPDQRDAGTLAHLLLDDLVGASLVSGYAIQRGGALEGTGPAGDAGRRGPDMSAIMLAQDDLCAGWAHDATMMVTIRSTGSVPMPSGPPAPVLERDDDPWAWHRLDPLAPHSMRRRRRLDVVAPAPGADGEDAGYHLDVHFRDSHVDEHRVETVVHEYSVSGRLDATGTRFDEVGARADVLPWMECPAALDSASRLVGLPLTDVRDRVRREFKGTSTCTHLNDTLRSLGDVSRLIAALRSDR